VAEPSVQIVAVLVRQLRKDRGWSQEDFAARCDLHRTYVGAIERAEENLTLRTLDKLAKALRVTPAALIRRSSDSPTEISAKQRRRGKKSPAIK
jgi:transcriptional regulator with XRE-family HTH domain